MTERLSMALHAASVRRGGKWVLRDVSWQLRPGERWALLGENGAGKTQLLKLLSGDIWPTPTGAVRPRRGQPSRERPPRVGRSYRLGRLPVDLIEAKHRVAYIGAERQDKYERYGWNPRVRDLVATGMHRTDLLLQPVTPEQRRRVTAAMRACGLYRLAGREFLSLSYGQKRLALLARALVQDPDWLLLDEFYNGLDAAYRRRIDAVLDAAGRRGQSWIATAHRAIDVPRGTERLIELAGGRVQAVKRLQRADLTRLTLRAGENLRATSPPSRTRPRVAATVPSAAGALGTAGSGGAVLLRLNDVDLFVEYRAV
ncbi:MAG TPA: ATP-binding cassette domain-containing protein, partial [Steroidobacteraceae bacterium]